MNKVIKKIAVASGKGGVGKSMIASVLTMLFAREKNVLSLDCDADTPNLDIWLGGVKKWDKIISVTTSSRPVVNYKQCDGCGLCAKKCRFGAIEMINNKPRINSFLCEGCGVCELICPKKAIELKPVQNGEIRIKEKFLSSNRNNFSLVSGQLLPGETGSGKVVSEIKRIGFKLFPKADLIIIDSAPGTGCPVTASLQDADYALLVTEATPSGFFDLQRVLKLVTHFGIPFGIVINKWDINLSLANRIKKWAGKNFLGKISYDKRIFQAVSQLKPILETQLRAKKEIKNIFQKLNKIG